MVATAGLRELSTRLCPCSYVDAGICGLPSPGRDAFRARRHPAVRAKALTPHSFPQNVATEPFVEGMAGLEGDGTERIFVLNPQQQRRGVRGDGAPVRQTEIGVRDRIPAYGATDGAAGASGSGFGYRSGAVAKCQCHAAG